jgi:hypothetical protein
MRPNADRDEVKSLRSNLRVRVLVPVAVLALLGVGFYAFALSGTPGGSGDPLPPVNHQPAAGGKGTPGAKLAAWRKDANAICATLNADTAELATPQSQAELLVLLPASLDLADKAVAELKALPMPKAQAKRIEKMLKQFAKFTAVQRQAVTALQANDAAGFSKLTAKAFAANDAGSAIARELGARQCAVGSTADSDLETQLERHRVVVAVLYAPGSNLDTMAIREARAGAALAGAGFVALNVFDTDEIAPVTAQYPVRESPSVLVFVRNKGAVSQFAGYLDRETVAQAADNAAL